MWRTAFGWDPKIFGRRIILTWRKIHSVDLQQSPIGRYLLVPLKRLCGAQKRGGGEEAESKPHNLVENLPQVVMLPTTHFGRTCKKKLMASKTWNPFICPDKVASSWGAKY
jgi:hypothetical protein